MCADARADTMLHCGRLLCSLTTHHAYGASKSRLQPGIRPIRDGDHIPGKGPLPLCTHGDGMSRALKCNADINWEQ